MGQTQPPVPPDVVSGQEIYDQIMRSIEPELTSTQLPLLPEKYPNETPEEKIARAARYTKAFAEYDKKFQEYCDKWGQDLRTYKRLATAFIEQEHRTGEQDNAMAEIESSLNTL